MSNYIVNENVLVELITMCNYYMLKKPKCNNEI